MLMIGRLGVALAAVSALVLLTACSGAGESQAGPPSYPGLTSLPTLGALAPTGIAGVSASRSAKPTPSRSGSTSPGQASSSGVASAGQHAPANGRTTVRGTASSSSPHRSTAAPPAAGPQVAVTPDSGLTGGQHVQVVASNFPAGAPVQIFECRGAACIRLALIDRIDTDASGRVAKTVTVSSHVYANSCGRSCVISVRADGSGASAPISFA